jgi:hypothetical protein
MNTKPCTSCGAPIYPTSVAPQKCYPCKRATAVALQKRKNAARTRKGTTWAPPAAHPWKKPGDPK